MDPNSNYIRVNELARELEIKCRVLIEHLPQIGITEKKDHSSSLDLQDADQVRKHFRTLAERDALSPTAALRPFTQPAPAAPAREKDEPFASQELTREQLIARIAELEAALASWSERKIVESQPRFRARTARKHRTRKKGKGRRRPRLCQGGLPSLGKRR